MPRTAKIVDVIGKKGIIKLEDQSIWRIPEGHYTRITAWGAGLELVLDKSQNAMYQYTLKNSADGVWVHATPHSGEAKFGKDI